MRLPVLALTLVLLAAGCAVPRDGADHGTDNGTDPAPDRGAAAQAAPSAPGVTLRVRRVVRGLDIPWDVQQIGHGRLLITQRSLPRLTIWENGRKRRVRFPENRVWTSGETGLMSLEIDPSFRRTGRFYTCQGGFVGDRHDVRVIAWRLNDAGTRARQLDVLLKRLPTSSGRHGGCRLLITSYGALLVGTGDAAIGRVPRTLRLLGGKTLRLNRFTGAPWRGNPFINADNRRKRYVFTYGHRNVQGLAERSDGTLWSVEHGPNRDDEVNRLRAGGDYGWNPVPGYNETVPMTDHSLPGPQVSARWSSGSPTLATSGAAWVRGARWGRFRGTLAVACLKASRVVFMKFDADGRLLWTRAPAALRNFGRLRSVTVAGNGDLLVTTSNGERRDSVLRVRPVS